MLAQVPGIGSPELKRNAGMLNEAYKNLDDMYELFSHFTVNEWIYETKAIVELDAQMTPEDRKVFFLDPKTFTWKQVVEGYFYGFMKYIQKEDLVHPEGPVQLLLNKNHLTYFENLRRAFLEQNIVTKDPVRIRRDTMHHMALYLEQQLAKPQLPGTTAPTKAAL